jgi:membrane-associated phospholipid phosphatase
VLVAAGSVVATAGIWIGAFHTTAGAGLDSAILEGFTQFRDSRLGPLADGAVTLADPLPFAAMACALAMIALARGRPRHAIVVAIVAVAATVTTELLKPLATVPRPAAAPQLAPAVDGWPSGHMTGAMTLALCLVLVAPARLRPSAAVLGGLFAAAQGYGVLVLGWHYPSDVLGSCAVATAWLALSVAAVGVVPDHARPGLPRVRPVIWPGAIAALIVAGLAGAAVLARPEHAAWYLESDTTFVAGALALGAAALGLVTFIAAALTLIERDAAGRNGRSPRLPA